MSLNNPNDENNEFEELDRGAFETEDVTEESQPASSNRTFKIAIGVLGGIIALALIALAVVYLLRQGQSGTPLVDQSAEIYAQNTATAGAATAGAATVRAALLSVGTQQAATEAPTNTPVIAVATNTPEPPPVTETVVPEVGGGLDPAARTATVSAFLTQIAAGGTLTPAPAGPTATATALPNTGFADDLRLPTLGAVTLGLLLVIILARRLRTSPR